MQTPATSVIIPTYNRAHLITRAVRSALAATQADDEILVIDDGSTDGTAEVLLPFGDRVRHLKPPHGGAGAARNHGIQAATRPLVAFLDSDDEWDADTLDLKRAFLAARPDVLFLFSDFRACESDGSISSRHLLTWSHDERGWDEILGPGLLYSAVAPLPSGRDDFKVHFGSMYLPLLSRFYMSSDTLVARREAARDALHFAEDVPIYEDLECFARLARAGRAAYFDCETATQHGHAGPRVTDYGTEEMTRSRLAVLERIWGQDPEFLREHGEEYRRCVLEQHLVRARWFLCRGRSREAYEELARVPHSPTSYRLLASLPGFMAKGLLGLRRAIRRDSTIPV